MGSWIRRNFFLVFFGIFAFVGTIMGIVAANSFLKRAKLTNDGIHTVGTVVDLVYSSSSDGNGMAPVVEFNLRDGSKRTYRSPVFSSPPSYQVGETAELWYNPANPDQVVLSGVDGWLVSLICGVFFLIFGGIGYGGLFYQLFKKRDVDWLKKNGQPVQADFSGIYINYNLKMNGASPWIIQAQWHDKVANKVYTFNSDNIWYDPARFVEGKKLTVLIDPKNPGMYFMDVSFLPEAGG